MALSVIERYEAAVNLRFYMLDRAEKFELFRLYLTLPTCERCQKLPATIVEEDTREVMCSVCDKLAKLALRKEVALGGLVKLSDDSFEK
jgi:hypothetical protein